MMTTRFVPWLAVRNQAAIGAPQGSVSAFRLRESLQTAQFANSCSRVLREQHCCSRNPVVRELIREQFANWLCLGFFTKLANFGGCFENCPVFSRKVRSIRIIS